DGGCPIISGSSTEPQLSGSNTGSVSDPGEGVALPCTVDRGLRERTDRGVPHGRSGTGLCRHRGAIPEYRPRRPYGVEASDGSPSWATVLSVEADFRTPVGDFPRRRGKWIIARRASCGDAGSRCVVTVPVRWRVEEATWCVRWRCWPRSSCRRWPGRSAAVVRGVSPWVRWRTPIPP